MRFLKNYTSDVPVSQTINRIEQVLIRCGVSGIGKEYGPKANVLALTFRIDEAPPVQVRLPVNADAALDALWLNYADGDKLSTDGNSIAWNSYKKKRKADFRDQAERTAWKLIQDWVEVQMSMIQMNQGELKEVFLPYIWDGERTVYRRIKDAGFRALIPESNQEAA